MRRARGREPGLRLERDGRDVDLIEWGQELLDEFVPIAALLDARLGGTAHHEALEVARVALADPSKLPSARVLAAMAAGFAGSHLDFVRSCSEAARQAVLALAWSDTDAAHYHALAEASRREQAAVEASDRLSFEAFRQHYLSPLQLQP
jgi:glutamate--cysteine ligase